MKLHLHVWSGNETTSTEVVWSGNATSSTEVVWSGNETRTLKLRGLGMRLESALQWFESG